MSPRPLWIDVIAVVIPAVAAILVLSGVVLTIRQKDRTDQKDQWWKRVQWAADAVLSSDEGQRRLGMSSLIALINSAGAISKDDAGMLQAIVSQVDLSAFAVAEGTHVPAQARVGTGPR